MPWRPIPDPSREERAALDQRFKRRARFLLDENLGPGLAKVLRDSGFNVKTAQELNLTGQPDEALHATARRENRLLITQDGDLLNDRRFPLHDHPGVVIVPNTTDIAMLASVFHVLSQIVGPLGELWRGSKVRVGGEGHVVVRSRSHDGRVGETRYRVPPGGGTFIWEDD